MTGVQIEPDSVQQAIEHDNHHIVIFRKETGIAAYSEQQILIELLINPPVFINICHDKKYKQK
jgi:putative NIF3 family GTP cyclohydrolase 1 type 2